MLGTSNLREWGRHGRGSGDGTIRPWSKWRRTNSSHLGSGNSVALFCDFLSKYWSLEKTNFLNKRFTRFYTGFFHPLLVVRLAIRTWYLTMPDEQKPTWRTLFLLKTVCFHSFKCLLLLLCCKIYFRYFCKFLKYFLLLNTVLHCSFYRLLEKSRL